ncbi:MAG: high-potential iron-sulfur protein [Bacteroidota bacterium]
MNNFFDRRQFIQQSLSAFGFGCLVASCTAPAKKEATYQLKSCQDLSQVSESELAKRKQFAYQIKASDPLKKCRDCKLYLPPKPGESCGSCSLFKGPVEAEGSCTYWAPLEG